MKLSRSLSVFSATLAVSSLLPLAQPLSAKDLAVHGATVYTMAGDPIKDGIVLVHDGKIAAGGKQGEVTIPENAEQLSAAVVMPGLIDARSTVGFSGILNSAHDQEQLETSSPMQPELRASF